MFCRKMLKTCVLVFCLALSLAAPAFAAVVSEADFLKLCEHGEVEEIEAAIQGGADVNARDEEGVTPLMTTAGRGSLEVLEVLLAAGADVNAKDDEGRTPLLYAGNYEHLHVLDALLKAGADQNVKYRGQTLREAVAYFGSREKARRIVSILDAYAPDAAALQNVPSLSAEEFFELCVDGTPTEIEMAIRGGADVNAVGALGETPLFFAVGFNDNPASVLLLIKAGANVNVRGRWGFTPLLDAAANSRKNAMVVISALIDAGADVNAREVNGFTPLHAAVENQRENAVAATSALIEAGADVNARGDDGHGMRLTVLMSAAMKTEIPELLSILLTAGADVNAKDSFGGTALIHAARENPNADVVRVLLEAGADANARDVYKKRAIDYMNDFGASRASAAYRMLQEASAADAGVPLDAEDFLELCLTGTPEEIEAAVQGRADINAMHMPYGWTVLGQVVERRPKFNPAFCPEVVSILLGAGANVNVKDRNGYTALLYAAVENVDPEIFRLLLEAGADVNAKNNDDVPVLVFAAMLVDRPEVLSALLEAGAEVDAKNKYGTTALILAAQGNPNPEVVTLLLEAGAIAAAKDIDGKRAIDYAAENEALKGTEAYEKLLEASR